MKLRGLGILLFEIDNIAGSITFLIDKGISVEVILIGEMTNKRFTFYIDPNILPIE